MITHEEAISVLDELGGACSSDKEYIACHMAIESLRKQMPQKPKIRITGTTDYSTEVKCPVCGAFVANIYCGKCGQKLESF